jgi:hypothetical protein
MKLLIVLSVLLIAVQASAQTYDYWPNSVSHTNSDEWLRTHHQDINLLQPNVLVLVADNSADLSDVKAFIQQVIYGVADGSRYHGYKDPKIPVQLMYQVKKIVDLRDHSKTRWPKIWPVTVKADGKPHFEYAGLYTSDMAKAIGFLDPKDPTRFFDLRELFEKGIINEVWTVYPEIDHQPDNGIAGVFETTARVQVYGEDGKPIPGKFDRCAGNGCITGKFGKANVTMRFAELNISLGAGCFLHATGHGFDNGLWRAIPEFKRASQRFLNLSLKQYGLPMDNLYDPCPLTPGQCWKYPNDHTIENAPIVRNIPNFKYENWGQGCGSVHFPPNGRHHDDYDNSQKVLNSCENFGLHNGKNGEDARTEYNNGPIIQKYEQLWPQCGGGWQVYMRQNFPGYGNHATMDDGTSMKSWWPYLYY